MKRSSSSTLPSVNKARLEMLFDGVFAIAMTLLVLEIKVPDLVDRHSARELFSALAHHYASFVGYALSFLMLGVFWVDTQRQHHAMQRFTTGILAVNLFLMATAAFFPFCAALFTRHVGNPGTFVVYFGDILLYRIGVLVQLWLARRYGLVDPGVDAKLVAGFHRRNVRAVVILTLAFCGILCASLV